MFRDTNPRPADPFQANPIWRLPGQDRRSQAGTPRPTQTNRADPSLLFAPRPVTHTYDPPPSGNSPGDRCSAAPGGMGSAVRSDSRPRPNPPPGSPSGDRLPRRFAHSSSARQTGSPTAPATPTSESPSPPDPDSTTAQPHPFARRPPTTLERPFGRRCPRCPRSPHGHPLSVNHPQILARISPLRSRSPAPNPAESERNHSSHATSHTRQE